MSRTCFRVNLHSRTPYLKQTRYLKFKWLQRDSTHNHLSQRHNHWVYICTVHLSVCFYHVMCTFQSESTVCSCLNVKELVIRNRRDIWSLNDCIILPVWRLFRARSFLEFRQLKNVDLWSVKRIRDMIRTLSQMHHTVLTT